MRGRSNYVVRIAQEDAPDEIYGPYTLKAAQEVVRRIERFYRKEAEACDEEYREGRPYVGYIRIGKWAPPEMRTAPKRPPCPSCGVKLDVWTSVFGDEETHGQCNNQACDDSRDYILEVRDDAYVIKGES